MLAARLPSSRRTHRPAAVHVGKRWPGAEREPRGRSGRAPSVDGLDGGLAVRPRTPPTGSVAASTNSARRDNAGLDRGSEAIQRDSVARPGKQEDGRQGIQRRPIDADEAAWFLDAEDRVTAAEEPATADIGTRGESRMSGAHCLNDGSGDARWLRPNLEGPHRVRPESDPEPRERKERA